MANNQLETLENKVDELIGLCKALKRENQMLKTANANWQHERKLLLEKNELARNKVANTIQSLRQAGQES